MAVEAAAEGDGERLGGDGETPGASSPDGTRCVLGMRGNHVRRGPSMRLEGLCGVGMSQPQEGSHGDRVVPPTSATSAGSSGMEVRSQTSTPWKDNVGRDRREGRVGSERDSGRSRCGACEVPGGGDTTESRSARLGLCRMDGLARSEKLCDGSAQPGGDCRSVLHVQTEAEQGDAGFLREHMDEDVGHGLSGSAEWKGHGKNVHMGQRIAGSSPSSETCGEGTSRCMGGDRAGSGGYPHGRRYGHEGGSQACSGVVGRAPSEDRMETATGSTCCDAVVGEGMGDRSRTGQGIAGVGRARQAQPYRTSAGTHASIDPGVGVRPTCGGGATSGSSGAGGQGSLAHEEGTEGEAWSSGFEIGEKGCGARGRRGRHGCGTGAGTSTRVEVDAGICGHDYISSSTESVRQGSRQDEGREKVIEDFIREMSMPTRAYNTSNLNIPSYARMLHADSDAIFPMPREQANGEQQDADWHDLPFAEAVVHTVDVRTLRKWMTDSEWQAVEVLTNAELFEQRVIRPHTVEEREAQQAKVRRSRITRAQWAELRLKRYVRKLRRDKTKFKCSGFAVLKADRKHLRFIWNGVPFNSICNPPPRFSITSMPTMIDRLFRKKVRFFFSWDYSTWFVQLMTDREVAKWFGIVTDAKEAEEVMMGEPMGWAWACAIAQYCSIAIMRNFLSELGATEEDVSVEICIDNCVVAVHAERFEQQQMVDALRKVCGEHGAVLKESALDVGERVEWMVYVLDAKEHRAEWKEGFQEKLSGVASKEWMKKEMPYRELWTIAGLVLFAMYAAGHVLIPLRRTLKWLAENSPSVEEWELQVDSIPADHLEDLRIAANLLVDDQHFMSPRRQINEYDAWIIADASTSGWDAYIVITSKGMMLKSYEGKGMIHERELAVQLEAMQDTIREGMVQPEGACFLLYGDNTTANKALKRGYALWCEGTDVDFAVLRRGDVRWEEERVETHRNVADAWTRVSSRVSVKQMFAECEHYRPGVICACIEEVLRRNDTASSGLEAKLVAWREAEGTRVPSVVSAWPYEDIRTSSDTDREGREKRGAQ